MPVQPQKVNIIWHGREEKSIFHCLRKMKTMLKSWRVRHTDLPYSDLGRIYLAQSQFSKVSWELSKPSEVSFTTGNSNDWIGLLLMFACFLLSFMSHSFLKICTLTDTCSRFYCGTWPFEWGFSWDLCGFPLMVSSKALKTWVFSQVS